MGPKLINYKKKTYKKFKFFFIYDFGLPRDGRGYFAVYRSSSTVTLVQYGRSA